LGNNAGRDGITILNQILRSTCGFVVYFYKYYLHKFQCGFIVLNFIYWESHYLFVTKYIFWNISSSYVTYINVFWSFSLVTRNSTNKVDKWDDRSSNFNPLHIWCNILTNWTKLTGHLHQCFYSKPLVTKMLFMKQLRDCLFKLHMHCKLSGLIIIYFNNIVLISWH
jgi:hypothetical protein